MDSIFIIIFILTILLIITVSRENKSINKKAKKRTKKQSDKYKKLKIQLLLSNKVKQDMQKYFSINLHIDCYNVIISKLDVFKETYSSHVIKAREFINQTTELKKIYFTSRDKNNLISNFKKSYYYFSNLPLKSKSVNDSIVSEFIKIYENLDTYINDWNIEYIKEELRKHAKLFDNIDGKTLDYKQRIAVITDDTNDLVIAGAGSGKTLTIAAKVKYLVECKSINPSDILLISFTNKSSAEMTDRINLKLGIPIQAMTFHKLGYSILNLNKSKVADNLNEIVSKYFTEKIVNDGEKINEILNFFLYYLNEPSDPNDYDTFGDYIDNQSTLDFSTLKAKYNLAMMSNKIQGMKNDLRTINSESVRSMEEVMIANFLFINGINYEYEKEYPFKNEEQPNRKYRPDFYLTDYDIYLEHFGINKDGNLPWLPKIEEQKYKKEMKWKRDFHKKNGTKLIETYSYYNREHKLLENLEKILKQNNVKFHKINLLEIYQKVYANDEDYHFKEFEKLIQTFIQLFKANGYDEADFYKLYTSIPETYSDQRNNAFINIVKPIFSFYQKTLRTNKLIDFNDMINLATSKINDGEFIHKYKYIIIDEYQDISFGRYKLIKSIIDKTSAKLFCVGDDWQSIYRFSGSDLTLFTNFSDYFGETKILKIEKTYRNSQELLDITKKFVEMNNDQIPKELTSDKTLVNPIVAFMYSTGAQVALHNALEDIYNNFGEEADVLLLGRTNFDINNYLSDSLCFNINTNEITYAPFPKMHIKFLTVHSSKGLEADNVIILNMSNTLLGFPNKISDDPVLSLVLQNKDSYEYAEERRLFYVALTRTRNRTYLIVPDQRKSVFFTDLLSIADIPIYANKNETTLKENPPCPRCRRGTLLLKESDGRKFIGCTNYPYCTFTSSCTQMLDSNKICPRCGGYLVIKDGVNGEFWGCSNYRSDNLGCNYTENLK